MLNKFKKAPWKSFFSRRAELHWALVSAALIDAVEASRWWSLSKGPLKAWSGLPGVAEFRENCAVGAVDAVLIVVLKSGIGITQEETRCGVDPVTIEQLRRQFPVLALYREGIEILVSLTVVLLQDDPQKTAVIELIGCSEIGQVGSKQAAGVDVKILNGVLKIKLEMTAELIANLWPDPSRVT